MHDCAGSSMALLCSDYDFHKVTDLEEGGEERCEAAPSYCIHHGAVSTQYEIRYNMPERYDILHGAELFTGEYMYKPCSQTCDFFGYMKAVTVCVTENGDGPGNKARRLLHAVGVAHSAVHNDVLHIQSGFQGEYWSATAQCAAEIDYIIITSSIILHHLHYISITSIHHHYIIMPWGIDYLC